MAGPLQGFKVIEMAGIGPGPFTAMMLADMGAEVVRVDRPNARVLNPDKDVLNRGRRSIAVDLKHPDGVQTVLRLVEKADALLEGFRPGVMERLGLGPDECLARNPRLVYGRMTGWGQDGPLAHAAGHDINYIAIAGVLNNFKRVGERPMPPNNLVGDFGGGGLLLAFGLVCALLEASRSGQGQVVDAAMVDGAAVLSTMLHAFVAMGLWQDNPGHNLLDTGTPTTLPARRSWNVTASPSRHPPPGSAAPPPTSLARRQRPASTPTRPLPTGASRPTSWPSCGKPAPSPSRRADAPWRRSFPST